MEGGILGLNDSCKHVYNTFQYGKSYATNPVITDDNTYYKFFLIELYLARFGSTYSGIKDPFKNSIEILYRIQACIHAYMKPMGDTETECINGFTEHLDNWALKHPDPKMQPEKGWVYMVNKKGELSKERIKALTSPTFKGFLERFSISLDNILVSQEFTPLMLYANVRGYNGEFHNEDFYKFLNEDKFQNNVFVTETFNNKYPLMKGLLPEDHIKFCIEKLKGVALKELKEYLKKVEKKANRNKSLTNMT